MLIDFHPHGTEPAVLASPDKLAAQWSHVHAALSCLPNYATDIAGRVFHGAFFWGGGGGRRVQRAARAARALLMPIHTHNSLSLSLSLSLSHRRLHPTNTNTKKLTQTCSTSPTRAAWAGAAARAARRRWATTTSPPWTRSTRGRPARPSSSSRCDCVSRRARGRSVFVCVFVRECVLSG